MFYSGSNFQSHSKHQFPSYILVLLFLHPCFNSDCNVMAPLSPTHVVFTAGIDKANSAPQMRTLFIGQEGLILPRGPPNTHGLEHGRQFFVEKQLPLDVDQVPTSVQQRWPRLLSGMFRILQTLPAALTRGCSEEHFHRLATMRG